LPALTERTAPSIHVAETPEGLDPVGARRLTAGLMDAADLIDPKTYD
jgi:hypothetical protein